jgi:uncharacterized repeat protein (TIGR01451 family)
MKSVIPATSDRNPHNFQIEDRSLLQLHSKRWQLVRQMARLAIGCSIVGYSLPAVAGTCVSSTITGSAITPYISGEVYGNSVNARSKVDELDDTWRTAISPQTSPSWTGTATNPIGNDVSNLFTINGVDVGVKFINIDPSTDCTGTVNTGTAPELSNSGTLQSGAPRPASLYEGDPSTTKYWNDLGGSNSNRNAALFTFSRPVSAFGAWFGDLETRTIGGGTPAIMRLLDQDGKQIGADILVTPNSISNGGIFSTLDQNTCGVANRCGKNSTRWIGFVDTFSSVKQVLVIVGDNDTPPLTGTIPDTTGKNERLSFIGVNLVSARISGTVFEDVNYGGGAGRPLSTAGTVGSANARVELYDGAGAFKGSVLTNSSGFYEFSSSNVVRGILPGNYTVRVVNKTVTSARTGYVNTLLPVQTFRTNGLTNNVGTPDPNRVGGEAPQSIDADNSSTTLPATAQSITPVTVGSADATGIDFGFNFDTIVNTNDGDQGSLRQFILNSNALDNTGLTGGREASIFMIPGQVGLTVGTATTTATAGIRAGVANQLTNGVAVITATTSLPPITGINTSIDGSIQTTNIGDTNTGTFGYAGLVGTGADGVTGTGDETSLTAIDKPEIEIQGISGNVLDIRGTNAIVRGVAIRGASGNPTGILIQAGANNFLVENSFIGFSANNFDDPGGSNRLTHGISASDTDNIIVRNNLVGFAGSFGVISSSSNTLVERNRFAAVGLVSLLTSRSEQMRYSGNGPATIRDNYFDATTVGQIDLGASQNVLVDNNTLENGHYVNSNDSYENAAIHARSGATNITISHNIIRNTQQNAHGVMVHSNGYGVAASRVKITQNSIFNSGKLGINLNPAGQDPTKTNDGVTPNDGDTSATSGNNGMDYPFITSSKLSGSTLTLKGYVGTNNPVTRTKFAAATVEFFVAATNSNDLGPVFSTDPTSVAKLHAEGQTYLGKCTTDDNGRFGTVASPCAFNVPTGTDPLKITSTATDPAGNTSEFSAEIGNDPQLVLVKRVTKIGTTAITTTIDDTRATTTATNDNQLKWPLANSSNGISPVLVGSIDTAKASPGEEIEYTIYFLSAGNAPIKSMNICDLVPANTTYVTGSGQISFNGAAASSLSNEYLPAGAVANTAGIGLCKTPRNPAINSLTAAENPRGLVWVKIDDYQTPLAPFDYGYIRFRALVKLTNP